MPESPSHKQWEGYGAIIVGNCRRRSEEVKKRFGITAKQPITSGDFVEISGFFDANGSIHRVGRLAMHLSGELSQRYCQEMTASGTPQCRALDDDNSTVETGGLTWVGSDTGVTAARWSVEGTVSLHGTLE